MNHLSFVNRVKIKKKGTIRRLNQKKMTKKMIFNKDKNEANYSFSKIFLNKSKRFTQYLLEIIKR